MLIPSIAIPISSVYRQGVFASRVNTEGKVIHYDFSCVGASKRLKVKRITLALPPRYAARYAAVSPRLVVLAISVNDEDSAFLLRSSASSDVAVIQGEVQDIHLTDHDRFVVIDKKIGRSYYAEVRSVTKPFGRLLLSVPGFVLGYGGQGYAVFDTQGTYHSGKGLMGRRVAQLAASRLRLAKQYHDIYDKWMTPSTVISPDGKSFFTTGLREFYSEGAHDYMVYYGADALVDRTGIRWQWKHAIRGGPRGTFYVSPREFAFYAPEPIVMGRTNHPKRYPAGIYVLNLQTWKPRRLPMSDQVLKQKSPGEFIGLR